MDARFLCRKTVSLIGYSLCFDKIPRDTRLKDKTDTTHFGERMEINEYYLMRMLTDTQDVDKCRKELFQILKRVIFDEYHTFLAEQESIRCQAKSWFKNYFNEARRYGVTENELNQFFLPLKKWGEIVHKPLSLNAPRNQVNTKHCVPWIDITDGSLFFREQYNDIIDRTKAEM